MPPDSEMSRDAPDVVVVDTRRVDVGSTSGYPPSKETALKNRTGETPRYRRSTRSKWEGGPCQKGNKVLQGVGSPKEKLSAEDLEGQTQKNLSQDHPGAEEADRGFPVIMIMRDYCCQCPYLCGQRIVTSSEGRLGRFPY